MHDCYYNRRKIKLKREKRLRQLRLVLVIVSMMAATSMAFAQTNQIVVVHQEDSEGSILDEPLPTYSHEWKETKVVTPPTVSETKKTYELPASYYKSYIYMHESGNDPYSVNKRSGSCGLGQAFPCSKMDCALGDYDCQDAWFENYMLNRYGSWKNAYYFWIAHNWW